MGLPEAVGIHRILDKLNVLTLKYLTQAEPEVVYSPLLPPCSEQASFLGNSPSWGGPGVFGCHCVKGGGWPWGRLHCPATCLCAVKLPPASCLLPLTPGLLKSFLLSSMDFEGH